MAVSDVSGSQGSFINRTKALEERKHQSQPVATGLIKPVGGTANAIYEPTASNGNTISTHVMVTSQSSVESLNTFSASMADGSSYTGKGLVVGTMYPIAFSYVSASTHVQIDLFGNQITS